MNIVKSSNLKPDHTITRQKWIQKGFWTLIHRMILRKTRRSPKYLLQHHNTNFGINLFEKHTESLGIIIPLY